MNATTLEVRGLNERRDALRVETALAALPSVHSVILDPVAGQAIVHHDGLVTDVMIDALRQIGFSEITETGRARP